MIPDSPIPELSFAHTYVKFIEMMIIHIMCPVLTSFLIPESEVSEEARGRWNALTDQYRTYTSFGFGIEGFTDRA